MTENCDMQAVARVAPRVELSLVRLVSLTVAWHAEPRGSLVPTLRHNFRPLESERGRVGVLCEYHLAAHSEGQRVADIEVQYLLGYEVRDSAPIATSDLKHFAHANGAFHSWPFVRELLHEMTGRVGLRPFVLPVLVGVPAKTTSLPRVKARPQKKVETTKG